MFQKKMVPILKVLCIVVAVIHFFELYMSYAHSKDIPAAVCGDVTVFHAEISAGEKIEKIDATQDYIFFCYHTDPAIAAYDWDGTYQFSLAFHKTANGAMEMRCEDGLLYVKDYSGYEFVLDGTEIVQLYSPKDSVHSIAWFREPSDFVYSINKKVYTIGGQYVMDLPGKT